MSSGRVWLAMAIIGAGFYAFKRFAPDGAPTATTSTGTGSGAMTIPESIDNEQPEIAPTEPRGIRNNNPLNIRHNSANNWQGMTGVDDAGFVVFDDVASGYRAADKILDSYARRDIVLVEDIINEWAPDSENNTSAYLDFVVSQDRIMAGMDTGGSNRALLLTAMVGFENGAEYIPTWQEIAPYMPSIG